MKKTFADQCLERASKATLGPWVVDKDEMIIAPAVKTVTRSARIILEPPIHMTNATREFIAHARTDVQELAQRLKYAIDSIRFAVNTFKDMKQMDKLANILLKQADELERAPEEK
jgi:hypothetical protein